LKEVKGKAVE